MLKRRIYAALIDALIVGLLELAVLFAFGHEMLQELSSRGLNIATQAGPIHLSIGPVAMFTDWFGIGLLDGLLVFIQPLTLLSMGKVSQLFSSADGQMWLICFFSLLVNALYRIIAEFLPGNASIGMRLFRLKVAYTAFTIRQNPIVRHFAKILTMPVVVIALIIGVPIAHVFARSDESDPGYYTRKLAGLDAAEMLHDEVADVMIESTDPADDVGDATS
jgi:hypothetical protein